MKEKEEIVYLNGEYLSYSQALIPVEDRGFIFGDGIYEAMRSYRGRLFRPDDHWKRLEESARAIRLELPLAREDFVRIGRELIERNGLSDREAVVYLQVTRGPAPRQHGFPAHPRPTVFAFARFEPGPDEETRKRGLKLITVPDRRWSMCYVKSVGLLPNVLARQEALERGADDALFHREGAITEAVAANFFAYISKRLYTHPEGAYILSGVTRQIVMVLCTKLGISVARAPLTLKDLPQVEEAFLTGTTVEILPVASVDGVSFPRVPGPVTEKLIQAFEELKRNELGLY